MSSFTSPLITKYLDGKNWELVESFRYHLGSKESGLTITVPSGFKTNFASIPKVFWAILPPHGEWGKASVLHDWLYYSQTYHRFISDAIFLEAMHVLNVTAWKKWVIYYSLVIFGGFAWRNKARLKRLGTIK